MDNSHYWSSGTSEGFINITGEASWNSAIAHGWTVDVITHILSFIK